MATPATTCVLDTLLAAKAERAVTPTSEPVVLSDEVRKNLRRLEQLRVDHIQRRDRNWDDALRGDK